jgi:tetratricopeptide (TPR) repeat protein
MRIDLGSVYRELGEQQKALESYQLALPLYRQTGDRGGEAAALTDIGNVYYALGDNTRPSTPTSSPRPSAARSATPPAKPRRSIISAPSMLNSAGTPLRSPTSTAR